ncbi:hypothetical protein B0J18DRAFT_88342 [Chaetomium sp. MPI-SDFR-AT-0129]|nr:hypothetical protein B0J18DRAFT_88342 [Chaetomium sp. MPI-SDFR-AT-0129]
MDTWVYSIESKIEQFFSTSTSTTKAECDIKAACLVGGPVEPVPVQGLWSYTVTAGPNQAHIVQFRDGRSALNMAHVDIARQVHPWCVPKCSYHGQTGGQPPLSIYVMEKRGGVCYIQTRDMSPEGKAQFEARQFQTVGDLARFFAEAGKGPQQVTPAIADSLRQELETDLDRLSEKLPDRFARTLNQVRDGLPRIFSLPFVITHGDLNESNILVDDVGRITAIIDRAESKILPFGMSLWALENILGYMDSTGWHYHDNTEELRDEFWRVLETNIGGVWKETKEAIRLARMVGLFLRYGFEQDGSARGRVRDTGSALRYADAFCTGGI